MSSVGEVEVAGVVLAGGAGRRFGMPKALVEHEGALLVERAARVLADGGCSPVLVVLGAAADEVRERADLTGAAVVLNPDWNTGMGSSLRVAIDALTSTDADAAVVMPVDMPGIGAAAVRRVAELASPSALAAAAHDGRRSHPVLLGREHWAGARAAATGDAGARGYLRDREVALVPCDDISAGFDVDRPEDLPRADT
ncbi:nicotine blue oxidoreductase [Saccharopolyspora antimicrobica]|uniref:Nicotine blue oxidoreductase n=1 Tax=Saccharopolyspora antimicrobica TaxID=455193 RepID=A0A1I5I4J2_9PSEU|nr:nucleotidyltransferase family protein [Saccharopolyspora antimicrobica]RKT83039.1 nicotine blue oxidoreductase [Saccharopolyspora antimicrobica]SFO55492.1 nicotine blue oxidoreductase [Saccharopolyspora antimicrobica]